MVLKKNVFYFVIIAHFKRIMRLKTKLILLRFFFTRNSAYNKMQRTDSLAPFTIQLTQIYCACLNKRTHRTQSTFIVWTKLKQINKCTMKKETRRSEKMKERSSVCNIRLLFFSFAVVRQNAALTSTDRIVKNEFKKNGTWYHTKVNWICKRNFIRRGFAQRKYISTTLCVLRAGTFSLSCFHENVLDARDFDGILPKRIRGLFISRVSQINHNHVLVRSTVCAVLVHALNRT